MRSFHFPGRSTVHALDGMAATSHPLASGIALEVLRHGGNAVDAAVTASAVLAVVEPQSTGIGGDCFALYCPGGQGRVFGLNGSGRAPAAAQAAWYRDQGFSQMPLDSSPHCVTVPGAIDAWDRLLSAHGTIDLTEALAPAIDYAETGYVVAPRVARDWAAAAGKLARDPVARKIFLMPEGAPKAGEVHRQPALAETLKTIARDGRDAFYQGAIAEDIVAGLRAFGGLHSLDDFARHEATEVEPITTRYRGYEMLQIPPNGQGIAVLLMLNILSGLKPADLDPDGLERFHLEGEVARLAYRVRDSMIGDPALANVPVDEILSAGFADTLRRRFDPEQAQYEFALDLAPAHADTVYLTVVDKDRNVISFINSLFNSFGSGLSSPETGVLLHNRGSGFRLDEGHPNAIAPGKRPLHTIIPGMVRRDGRVEMSYGVMGGHFQPAGHVHFLTNVIDYGMDLQEALDHPRAFHFQGAFTLEDGISQEVEQGLSAKGHLVARGGPHGGGQAIRIDWQRGTLTGGSDPRKDGCAIGY